MRIMYLSRSERMFQFGQNTRYRLGKMREKFVELRARFKLSHQGIWGKWGAVVVCAGKGTTMWCKGILPICGR